jgi:hypothetical protein
MYFRDRKVIPGSKGRVRVVHQNHEDEKNSSEFFEPSRIEGFVSLLAHYIFTGLLSQVRYLRAG